MIKFIFALFVASIPLTAIADQVYTLNPGDVLAISVWKEEGLQGEVLVLPDGTISFPLAGQMNVAGRTVQEVEQELAQKLDRYIPGPVVAVSVLNAAGNSIYVTGAVRQPGQYQVVQPTDVMQAISLAGGLTEFASENRIQILRRENGNQVTIPFRYSDVSRGRDLKSNVELQSGDTVVVPVASLF
ncbi:MAG: polysaccharide biosynthesis/export family protein [Rhodospirillales bacterium]|nr:polysaccharide biosynthesis/export family protein [Rhodospirillales bacterium]